MTTPERIWLDKDFLPWRVWTIEMSELPEYIRRDPAVLAELPEVREAIRRALYATRDMSWSAVEAMICDDEAISAAIKEGRG